MESSESQAQGQTENPNHPQDAIRSRQKSGGSKKKKLIGLLVILAIISLLVGAGWFIFNDASAPVETDDTAGSLTQPTTTQEVATPTPTPTSTPLDREETTIIVRNGTGIPREASVMGDILVDLGYAEDQMELVNADDQDEDLETTTVVFSSDFSQEGIDEITEALEDEYVEVDVKKSSSTDYDVDITTGLRQNSGSSSPTATPTPAEEDETTPTPTESESTPTPTP